MKGQQFIGIGTELRKPIRDVVALRLAALGNHYYPESARTGGGRDVAEAMEEGLLGGTMIAEEPGH